MHEFSVAGDIVENIIVEAQKHHAEKVTGVFLEIGQLMMVEIDQLRFALECLSKDTLLENANIHMETTPIVIKCINGHEEEVSWDPYKKPLELTCPVCKNTVKIIKGRECIIRKIVAE